MFNKDKIFNLRYYRDKLCLSKWINLGELLVIYLFYSRELGSDVTEIDVDDDE